MRNLTVLLALAIVVLAVLFVTGVFESATGPGPVLPSDQPQTSGDDDDEGPLLVGPPPADRPPLEVFPIEQDVRVLLLVSAPQRFNAFLAQQWSRHPRVDVVSWTGTPSRAAAGSGPPPGSVLPNALEETPRAGLLDDEEIDVVVVHDLDPAQISDEFWTEVVRRVEDGRMGLLALPGPMHGNAMLDHPILGPLLPVEEVRPIEGQPAPGVYATLVSFEVTGPGQRHPVTRLVPWPTWSREIWQFTRTLDAPWGARFCFPVETVKPGAVVLLATDPEHGDGWPAMIVGAPQSGRVLWFGALEIGPHAGYGRPSVVGDWGILLKNWLAWLAGIVSE